MGLPDMDLYTADDNLRTVAHVVQAGDLAVMADLDNGYGGPLTVARVAAQFEAAGASALMLEDQATPKRCPFYPGEPLHLTSVARSAANIAAAVEGCRDERTIVIARTDAKSTDDIVRRAEAFAEAGAHMIMPNSPGEQFTLDEWAKLHQAVGLPLVGSALPGSWLEKELTDEVCLEVGIQVRIDALHALYAATALLVDLFSDMRENGVSAAEKYRTVSHHDFGTMMREAEYRELQKRYEVDSD